MVWDGLGQCRILWALTEHGLQAHEAADEAVEVQRQVGLGVAGDEQLVQPLVEAVPWARDSQGSLGSPGDSRDSQGSLGTAGTA